MYAYNVIFCVVLSSLDRYNSVLNVVNVLLYAYNVIFYVVLLVLYGYNSIFYPISVMIAYKNSHNDNLMAVFSLFKIYFLLLLLLALDSVGLYFSRMVLGVLCQVHIRQVPHSPQSGPY